MLSDTFLYYRLLTKTEVSLKLKVLTLNYRISGIKNVFSYHRFVLTSSTDSNNSLK